MVFAFYLLAAIRSENTQASASADKLAVFKLAQPIVYSLFRQ